tara:strand:- start:237 stop:566 length:330 start_codon:yes stop_codon:yes gene_type:complete
MWYKLHYYDKSFGKDHHFWYPADSIKDLAGFLMNKYYDLNDFVSVHTEKKFINGNFNFKKYKGPSPAKLEGKNLKDKMMTYWDPKKVPERNAQDKKVKVPKRTNKKRSL